MDSNRKALYNSLRMNWLIDPDPDIELWKVENWRKKSTDSLFQELEDFNIHLETTSFIHFAENFPSPEALTESLIAGQEIDSDEEDYLYLHIFELWRRLKPEKPSLSLICDELDTQIELLEEGDTTTLEGIEQSLSTLRQVLEDNEDEGKEPEGIFQCVQNACAHDLEAFLYDFAASQFDEANIDYATELVEAFHEFVSDKKWFDLLKIRLLSDTDPEAALGKMEELLQETKDLHDLTFNLETLSYLVEIGDEKLFARMTKETLALIEIEGDFQEILAMCKDFYHLLDYDEEAEKLGALLSARFEKEVDDLIASNDDDLKKLAKMMDSLLTAS